MNLCWKLYPIHMLASGSNNLGNSIRRLVKKTFKLIIAKKKQPYELSEMRAGERRWFSVEGLFARIGFGVLHYSRQFRSILHPGKDEAECSRYSLTLIILPNISRGAHVGWRNVPQPKSACIEVCL